MKVCVNLIATRSYIIYVQPLIEDIKKYFLVNHTIEVNLFTDNPKSYIGDERVTVKQFVILPYTFPAATLYRYAVMTSIEYDCDFIIYMDIDTSIVANIEDDEIMGNLVAVRHPGFYVSNSGSWETNEKSTSYVPPEKRIKYFAGGVQAGFTKDYLRAMTWMKEAIDEDERNGIVPVWHDESAWNRYLSECESFKELTPAFCMVEQINLREAWGIINIQPKIIALAKDHKTMRE